ncbi:MAG: hypothetical protein ABFS32_16475 [Bacteroidota bacterium]
MLIFNSCSDSTVLQTSELEIVQNSNRELLLYQMGNNTSAIINPIRLELENNNLDTTIYMNYGSIKKIKNGFTAQVIYEVDSVKIQFNDIWSVDNSALQITRTVKVIGNSNKAFLSAIEFEFVGHNRENTAYFVPGMIYGSTENLTKSAIGGEDIYTLGTGKLWVREDRMPAPLMAFMFNNGSSFSILNANPNGNTTTEDAHDVEIKTIIDENMQFGSLYAEQDDNVLKTGYAFPGSEGEFTYQGNTYPGGQHHKWRKRYHPLKDGLTQEYTLSFNFSENDNLQALYSSEWQRAFKILKPKVNKQDIELARKTMLSIIPDLVVRKSNKVGLSNWYDATDPTNKLIDNKAVFGFTGKNLEVAYYLLYNSKNNLKYKSLAYEIINSFIDIKVNPPAGEGYYFDDGMPALAIPHHNHIYLRSFGDGMKVLARAFQLEKENGIEHPEWLVWMSDFGNWVLTQQYLDGGFPRAWKPGTGEISVGSPASSYNIIPFLCEMYNITKDEKWIDSAVKTGEFTWKSGHNKGRFIGGTIDNPDVLDKEAGTLSTEAYISLFEATNDKKWLHRAEIAAQFAETWMYLWNVPMVENDTVKEWATDVSTVGMQLISTGHSLTDNYMAFDVDEYAKLYRYTGNKHYFDVAKILLHNTKGMLALSGRQYQYRAPGWIQEHWSLAPSRGKALHPGWLPWVTTSNLNGICETENFDKKLYKKLKE